VLSNKSKMNIVRFPSVPKGGSKRKTAVIELKSHFVGKSTIKFVCVKTVSDKVVRYSLTSVRRLAVAKRPCDCYYSIFARIVSARTASEKSSINTNRKSTTRFPMSLR